MALNDIGNNGNYSGGNGNTTGNRVFDQTYYSRIRIKNKDKLAVSFTYSRGLLKVEISEEKEGYKYDPITYINLSPTKAKLLINELEPMVQKMKEGVPISPTEAVGVNSGLKDPVRFIAFRVTGKRSDVPEHAFVIGEVTSDGIVQNTVQFVFNVDYDYSINWKDLETMDIEKKIDQFMGIQTFIDILKEFAYTSGGGLGANVYDIGRYETNRILRKMDPIYDKLGIERKNPNVQGNSYNNYRSNGVGNAMNPPTNPRSSNHMSYEDVEDMLS